MVKRAAGIILAAVLAVAAGLARPEAERRGVENGRVEKADHGGEMWRAWTEESPSGGSVWLARLNGEQTFQPLRLAEGQDILFSPSFDFDLAGNPWLAWIATDGETSRVVARNAVSGRNEVLSPTAFASVSSVRLAVDGRDRVWVVWSGRTSGRDEIFARRFNGFVWEPPERLSSEPGRPSLLPCVAAAPSGEPWVLWSAYDGNDYEIVGARHTDDGWVRLPQVTDNGANDLLPRLTAAAGGRWTASWQRTTASGPAERMRAWTGRAWGPEAQADQEPGTLTSRARPDRRSSLRGPLKDAFAAPPAEREEAPAPAAAADLDDDSYICFGDSITYGVINHEYEPEKGYVPRLTLLVEKFYGPSAVFNEGSPGENTLNGLGRIDSVIARRRGRYLFLMEGTNDIIFNEISTDASTFHLEQMVRKCLQARVYPIISTIPPRNDWRWAQKLYRDRINNLNANIAKIATNLHIGFVDMFTVFFTHPASEGGWQSLFSDDDHPNEEGYALMSREWFSELVRTPFCPVEEGARRTVERTLFNDRLLNLLTWRHNPKIFNPVEDMTYTIYRRDTTVSGSTFQVLARLPFSLFHAAQAYFDMTIISAHRYQYAITLTRADGAEGPFSDLFSD